MASTSRQQSKVRFGPFEVDCAAGELHKHGIRIKLQKQPFQILIALLEHPNEVLNREELRHRIWSNDTYVDFDHGVNAAINKIRQALGDSPENPRYTKPFQASAIACSAQLNLSLKPPYRKYLSALMQSRAGTGSILPLLL